MQEIGFVGCSSPKDIHLGPWSDYILLEDQTKPDKPIIGARETTVIVRWPSMSGEGLKCDTVFPRCGDTGSAGGYGFNMNWFDPTRPMFYPNITDQIVKDTIRQIGGKDEPPLGPQRAPEVIVAVGIEGKHVEGVYVSLIPQDGQAIPPSSVATDRDGTAWFHLWDTGRYIARAEYNGKVIEKPFHIAGRN